MGNPSSLSRLAKTNDRHADKAEGASVMSDWINEPGTPDPETPETSGPNDQDETDDQDEPLKRLNVDIPESMHKALKRKALDEDTTVKQLVVAALKEAVNP
jgi:hypothetical protein